MPRAGREQSEGARQTRDGPQRDGERDALDEAAGALPDCLEGRGEVDGGGEVDGVGGPEEGGGLGVDLAVYACDGEGEGGLGGSGGLRGVVCGGGRWRG